MDECFTAADQIFVEAGNALVHAVRHGVCGVFAVKFLRLILHEQRVAAFVKRGKNIGDEIIFIIMRRDAHVFGAEVCGKRMLGRHEDERFLVQPLQFQQVFGERLLLRNGARAGHEIHADGLALRLNAPHQRDDPRAQRVKERIKLTDAAALFGVVQKRVVICRLFLFTQIERLMRVGNDLGQRTAEHGKVRRLLRLQPFGIGAVVGKAHLIIELRRDILFLLPRLIQVLHDLLLHRRQSLPVRVQLGYTLGGALGVREPEIAVRQNGHIRARLLHAVLRRAALHI